MKSQIFIGISCATLGLVTLPAIGQSITDPTNPKYRPKTAEDQSEGRNQDSQYNRQPDYRDDNRDRDGNSRTGGVREVQPGNTQWDRDDRNRWNDQDQRGGQNYNNQNTYNQNNQNRYNQNYGQTSSAGMLSQMAGTWRVDVRMNPTALGHTKSSSTRSDWDANSTRNSQSRNNTNPNNPQGGIDSRHQNRNTDPTNITSSTNPGNPNDRPIGNTNTTTNTNWNDNTNWNNQNNNNNNNNNNWNSNSNFAGADSKTAYAAADLIMNGNILRQVLVSSDMGSASGVQGGNDMGRINAGQNAFRGISYLSFDEQNNQYSAAFMDSMSGDLHVSKGTYDAGSRRITLESQTDDSTNQASGKNKDKRVVIEFLDNDRYQVTMYKDGAGKSTTTNTNTNTNRNAGGSLSEDVVYIATYTRASGNEISNINRDVYQDQMLFPNGRGMNRDWNRDNWNRDNNTRDNWNRDDNTRDNWNRDDNTRDNWNRDDNTRDNWNRDDNTRDNWNRDDNNRDNWNRDDNSRDNWNRDDTNRDDWNRDQRRNQGTTPGSTNPGNPR